MAYNPKKKVFDIIKKLKKQSKKKTYSVLDKQKFLKKTAENLENNKTWPELEFEKLMNELEIPFQPQKIVGQKIFDYYIPSKNMLVEVDGCYYHGNPEKFPVLNKMQKRNQRNDKFKNVLALGNGYSLERIWESDLKNKYDEVKLRFQLILKG